MYIYIICTYTHYKYIYIYVCVCVTHLETNTKKIVSFVEENMGTEWNI